MEISIHAQEEIVAGFLLTLFFVWVVVSLTVGFGAARHKNHYIRLNAKARRRAARSIRA